MRVPWFTALLLIVSLGSAAFGVSAKPRKTPICQYITVEQFEVQKKQWKGRELVGFASWCASCQSKIKRVQKDPKNYVVLAVFDEMEAVEATLARLRVTAPCIQGEALKELFDIRELPWSAKL